MSVKSTTSLLGTGSGCVVVDEALTVLHVLTSTLSESISPDDVLSISIIVDEVRTVLLLALSSSKSMATMLSVDDDELSNSFTEAVDEVPTILLDDELRERTRFSTEDEVLTVLLLALSSSEPMMKGVDFVMPNNEAVNEAPTVLLDDEKPPCI